MVSSDASVTMTATSMTRSRSGSSPVISMSTQTRRSSSPGFASCGMSSQTRAGSTRSGAGSCDIIFAVRPRATRRPTMRLRECPRDACAVGSDVLTCSPPSSSSRSSRPPSAGCGCRRARSRTSRRIVLPCRRASPNACRSPRTSKAADYTIARTRLGMIDTLVGAALLVGADAARRPAGDRRPARAAARRRRAAVARARVRRGRRAAVLARRAADRLVPAVPPRGALRLQPHDAAAVGSPTSSRARCSAR